MNVGDDINAVMATQIIEAMEKQVRELRIEVDILRAQKARLELEHARLHQGLLVTEDDLARVANAYVDECHRNGSAVPRAELLDRLGLEDGEP